MPRIVTRARRLEGELRVPSDRSITVRAMLLAALAQGKSRIRRPLEAGDTLAAQGVLKRLGVAHSYDLAAEELVVVGRGLHGLRPASASASSPVTISCGSSGATLRLMAGVLAGQSFASVLDGSAQLRARPMRRLTRPLRALGATLEDTSGHAPLYLQPTVLRGGKLTLPQASAQVVSALLLAGLYARDSVEVTVPCPVRDHTSLLLAAMGAEIHMEPHWHRVAPPEGELEPLDLRVPGDFSSAAFFLVAGTLLPGDLTLREVGLNPTRSGLLEALAAMGAPVAVIERDPSGPERVADLVPRRRPLSGVTIAGALSANMMDELPVLAVAATQAAGTTVVRDARELRVKESDRIRAMVRELSAMGAVIEERADGFVIEGPRPLKGATVHAHGDHRVAMALSVAALVADGPTTIRGAEAVGKTYPQFFDHLERVDGEAQDK